MPRPRKISAHRQHEIDAMDMLPLVTRCLICGWHTSGPARVARQEAAEHRLRAHPELPPYKRPLRQSLKHFISPDLNDEERDDIERDRRRRAYLAGVDIEE